MGEYTAGGRCGQEMRWILLLGIIALATVARAEDVTQDEDDFDLAEELDTGDLKEAFEGLFTFNDDDDDEHNMELGERESRAMDGESAVEQKAVVEPADQARYNKFIDTFFRRVNADARAEIDPLQVGLIKKKKKARKSDAKKGNKKDDSKKDGKRLNPKDNKKKPKAKKPKKNKNKNKNKQNKKKTGRHPKNLQLGVADEGEMNEEETAAVEPEGEAVHHVEARSADLEEEIEDEDEVEDEAPERQERSVGAEDDEEIADSDDPISRSGRPA